MSWQFNLKKGANMPQPHAHASIVLTGLLKLLVKGKIRALLSLRFGPRRRCAQVWRPRRQRSIQSTKHCKKKSTFHPKKKISKKKKTKTVKNLPLPLSLSVLLSLSRSLSLSLSLSRLHTLVQRELTTTVLLFHIKVHAHACVVV